MTGFDHILHRANGTLVELNSQVGTFRAVTSERLTAVRQDVSSAELTLISSEAFTVNVGDWIQVKGIRLYCMSTIDRYTCSEDNNREYQLTFYSPEYYLRLAIFYNTSESESGGVYSYSRVDNTYPSVGTFEDFVKLCCYNCNSVQGERMFRVGTISEDIATDIRVITFSDYNCLAVMKQSCESFETTWKVRVNEDPEPDSVFVIDFGSAIEDFPVTLKVEHAQGLTSIDVTASDKDVYTQFVIKGGSENLPSDYPYPNLQLDEDLSSTPQVLANSMIKLPDLYSRWGKSIKELTYEDIKPSRTGTVTSISENILKFTDSDLIGAAWSPVGGTIHFVSGHLIGFTFNCQDFNSATGEITIESTEENNGFILPSPTDSYYRINELDKYNIAGVSLPSSYITAAKTALKERALLGIDYWSQPRMQYAITIDPKIISVEIVPNMGFHIEHSALGIDKVINVQQVVYDLSKESPYDIESILISDLKTDDSKADSTHRQVATNRNIVNGTGANNVYSAKLLSRQRILDDYAKSQGLPNWGTFMEILSSGKGLWKDEDGNWWLNVAAIKAGAIGAELINVTQLIANEVFINGVEDTAGNLVNNYLLHLTSQVATVACDSEGTVTGTLPTSTAIVYHGASADTGWSFSGELSGCTGSVNEGTGVITITGLTSDDSTVTVSATKADKPMLQSIFRMSKVYAGADGADGDDGAAGADGDDAVYYYLTPSVDAVIRSMDGTATPSTVSCAQYKIQGGGTPVAANKTIKYQRSIDGTMQTYSTAVAVSTSAYIDFYLYDGVTELWRTRVPVLHDLDEWESTLNDFAKGLGYADGGGTSAYEKLVGAALAGKTIMEGGYLRNSLIDTEHLIAHDAFINRIATNSLTIGQITDTAAALDDAIQVGGRNLLLNSKVPKTGTSYNIGTWTSSRYFITGETLTVTIKGNIPGTKLFGLWFNSASIGTGSIPKIKDGYYSKQLVVPAGVTTRGVGLYLIGNQTDADNWEFEWIKLESGNKPTDWTPAPEDVQEDYATKLGYSSYATLVAEATEGSTIISGGHINTSLIDADAIIAEMAYIGGLTIGENKLYLGAGNYANSNTPFYVDSTNHFSLGSKLTFDGADLTQNGVKIGGGSMVGTSIDIPNATTPLFKVTAAGVITAKSGTIGGVNFTDTKLYLGTGTYGNSDTGFYVDTSAKFSLKDKLKFDGTNLTINGGGTFSGALSAATGSFSGSLSAASGTFEGLLDVGGIKIGLNAISTGVDGLYIDTNNYWDENGNFKAGGSASYVYWNGTTLAIKGDITGSTGTFGGVFAGTITAGDAVFGVSADGAGNDGLYINSYNYWYDTGIFKVGSSTKYLHFDGTNATFTGTLSAASGTFGGTVAIGETLKIGASVNGANDGIFINTNNYWYGTGALKIGDASAYLSYNAGALTMEGGSITSGKFETKPDSDGTVVSVKDNNVSGRGGFFLSNVGDGVGITLRYDYAAEEGRLVIYQSGGSSAVLTQNSLEIDDGVSASLLTTTGINVGGTIFNAATIGAGSVGKSACGFLRAASSSKQNEDSTHTHQYVNGYKVSVVAALPGTPATDTIYFVTGS